MSWKEKMKAAAARGDSNARKAAKGLDRYAADVRQLTADVAALKADRRLEERLAALEAPRQTTTHAASGAWFDELVDAATNWDREALAVLRKRAQSRDERSIAALKAMNEPTSELVASSVHHRLKMGYRAQGYASRPTLTPTQARAGHR